MTKNLVEIIAFCADDDSGTFCEALILQHNGKEIYLARQASITADYNQSGYVEGSARYVNHKIEVSSKQELEAGFPYYSSQSPGWQATDKGLGYNIPEEAQVQALHTYREKEDKRWERNRNRTDEQTL